MAQYVKYGNNGVIVDTKPCGRGRPPAGYVRVEDDGTLSASKPQTSNETESKAEMEYVRFDASGKNVIERRPCGRGRPPAGFVKVPKGADTADVTVPAIESNEEEIPDEVAAILREDEELNKETNQLSIEVAKRIDRVVEMTNSSEETPTSNVATATEVSPHPLKIVRATKQISLKDFEGLINPIRINQGLGENKSIITYRGCDLTGAPDNPFPLDWFKFNMNLARIDVDTSNGNVVVYRMDEKAKVPDVVIEGALIVP